VYQDYRLFDWMSVGENVAFPCRALSWTDADTTTAVADVLQRVGLKVRADRMVRDLSGGERQRVALARALVFHPRALLLDEPFAHLDPPLREELKRDLVSFLQRADIPVILVTHDYGEAFELCDRVGVMIGGSLVQVGQPEDLLSYPESLDVARLLGFANALEGTVLGVKDSAVQLRLDGTSDALIGRAVPGSITVGARACGVCRPERIALTRGQSASDNVLDARVLTVHVLSDATLITLTISDTLQWTTRVPRSGGFAAGESVKASISPDDLLVYPLKTL
jgi:ABC-type Fe3+/spermidine/putrescine transport system ATPase subunit